MVTETTRISDWLASYSGHSYRVALWDTGLSLTRLCVDICVTTKRLEEDQRKDWSNFQLPNTIISHEIFPGILWNNLFASLVSGI